MSVDWQGHPEWTAWLADNAPTMTCAELIDGFEELSGHLVTKSCMYARLRSLGLHPSGPHGIVDWRAHPEWVEWLCAYVPGHSVADTIDAFERETGVRLRRPQLAMLRQARGVCHGTCGGRWEKGHVPANKGRPVDEWMSPEMQSRVAQSRFKRGQLPHNAVGVPVGTERLTKKGYVEVKVGEHKSSRNGGRNNDNWRMKNQVVWEEANGRPVPEGYCVMFADRDKTNFDPANLVLVDRATKATIAKLGLDYWDADSLAVACARARLIGAARKAEGRP